MTENPARARLVTALRERRAASLPLTATQEGIWLAEQVDPGRSGYHDLAAVRLRGPLDPGCLAEALADLQVQHEALRCRMMVDDADPRQVFDVGDVAWATSDLSKLTEQAREPMLRRLVGVDAVEPFDFTGGPLWRARLIRLAPGEHVLVLVLHHVITDGWSHTVALACLLACYEARVNGMPPPPPVHGYSRWLVDKVRRDRRATTAELTESAARRLAGAPRVLSLPGLDRGVSDRRAGVVPVAVSPAEGHAFALACRRLGATAFMGMAGLFGQLLARAAGTDDVVMAAPVADRADPTTAALVGCLVDLVPVRIRAGADTQHAVHAGRRGVIDALAGAGVPYRVLARRSGAALTADDSLTNIGLEEFNAPATARQVGQLSVEPLPREWLRLRHDLTLSVPQDSRHAAELLFPVARWAPNAVAALADQLGEAIRGAGKLHSGQC